MTLDANDEGIIDSRHEKARARLRMLAIKHAPPSR
jgi:hypothetical protein